MLQTLAEIVDRHTEGASQEIRLRAPDLARMLAPGRAVLLSAGAHLQPYLRRTFYPIAYDDETFTVRITPGDDWGHAWLRAAPEGSMLDCLGPVGNGFEVPAAARNLVVLAEGDAVWTLLPALLSAERAGKNVALACTAAGRGQLFPSQRLPARVEYAVTTGGHSLERRRRFAGSIAPLLAWSDTLLAAGGLDFYAWLAPVIQSAAHCAQPWLCPGALSGGFLLWRWSMPELRCRRRRRPATRLLARSGV